MKVLVTGRGGQLATALRQLPKAASYTYLSRGELDLSKPANIAAALEPYQFDVLINTAAYTAVDKAESESTLAHLVNGEAPAALAEVCARRDALLLHLSTDYVFGQVSPSPLREEQATQPSTVYGASKLSGEQAIQRSQARAIILRTSWLYHEHGHNFVNTMLRLGQSGQALQVVYDQLGSPTYAGHLAEAILQLIGSDYRTVPTGIYHYSNEGVASWYDFALAIFELAGVEAQVTPVRSSQFPTAAKRPAYSLLDKQKIKDTFGIQIAHWRKALAECLSHSTSV